MYYVHMYVCRIFKLIKNINLNKIYMFSYLHLVNIYYRLMRIAIHFIFFPRNKYVVLFFVDDTYSNIILLMQILLIY